MTGASDGPVATASAFVDAVAWAEHTRVWDLLSVTARAAVLDLATRRGMDALLAARLREGTTGADERDEFLSDLLHGVRADLGDIDLDGVRCVEGGWDEGPAGTAVVHLVVDVPPELGGPVPVGIVELVAEQEAGWRVTRVGRWG